MARQVAARPARPNEIENVFGAILRYHGSTVPLWRIHPLVGRSTEPGHKAWRVLRDPSGADNSKVLFPDIAGRSLAGAALQIPDDLAGQTNVLLLAFQQRQQRDIDGLIDALGQRGIDTSPPHDTQGLPTGERVEVVLYEIPLLGAKWQPFRSFIDGGMASNIGVPAVLARTVTAYGQIGAVERSLNLPSRDQVYAVVVRGRDVLAVQPGWPGDVDAIVTAAFAD